MKSATLALVLALTALPLFAADVALPVPSGKTVMPDGLIETDEWKDARRVDIGGADLLYVKRDAEYLYVAVQPATTAMFGIDLYLDDGRATVLNLHASASLGEREGSGASWPQWKWWNNQGWTANVARVESWEPRKFLRDAAKEYQIRISRLRSTTFGLSISVESREASQMLPRDGVEKHGRKWVQLVLAD